MAKAILVINAPECCSHCRLEMHVYDKNDYQNWCPFGFIGYGVEGDLYNIKPDWCPLIKLPDDIDSEKLIKLFYKLYDEIVEDSNYGKSKQATLKLIADGIELLNIMGMNEE